MLSVFTAVSQPKAGDWRTEDIATVGELLLDISITLAKT
jgi:peroxidase